MRAKQSMFRVRGDWSLLSGGLAMIAAVAMLGTGGCGPEQTGRQLRGTSAVSGLEPENRLPATRESSQRPGRDSAMLQVPVSPRAESGTTDTKSPQPRSDEDHIDAGAAELIEQLRAAIGAESFEAGRVEIAMRRLRNQSRAGIDEIDRVGGRLLSLLGPAGAVDDLEFVSGETPRTGYTLGGTIYLIERDGQEFWEIYFALRPAGASWRIWRNSEPVRLERERRIAGFDRLEFGGR